ncbi:MAG: Rossmann-like and DUF2520 domain-containing protein [Candidatus Aquicultorales bacterium]
MERIGIIGAGKVGIALAHALASAGFPVSISSRSERSLQAATEHVPSVELERSLLDLVRSSRVVLIAVPDSQVEPVATAIAEASRGKIVYHTSGALSKKSLSAVADAGAEVGCLHPIQTFATVSSAIKLLPGSYFGVTAEGKARSTAGSIVGSLGGRVVEVSDGDRPIYHAAASSASNFFVALTAYASDLLQTIGISRADAERCLLPLVRGTLSNIEDLGTAQALTGPIARGDAITVRLHLDSIAERLPAALPVYKALADRTVELGIEKGTLDIGAAERIREALTEPRI